MFAPSNVSCYKSTPATARRLRISEIRFSSALASCVAGSFNVACIFLPNDSQSVNPMRITQWPLSVPCPMLIWLSVKLSAPTSRHHSYGHVFSP